MTVKKEEKYLVLKLEDIKKYLSEWEAQGLTTAIDVIDGGRVGDGKVGSPSYIICNRDEPYAEKVWQMILEGERAKVVQYGITRSGGSAVFAPFTSLADAWAHLMNFSKNLIRRDVTYYLNRYHQGYTTRLASFSLDDGLQLTATAARALEQMDQIPGFFEVEG